MSWPQRYPRRLGWRSVLAECPTRLRARIVPLASAEAQASFLSSSSPGQFTERERDWIEAQAHPELHWASTTTAKAVVSDTLTGAGARDVLTGIEVRRDEAGAPFVLLSGDAYEAALDRGVAGVSVSLSSDSGVVAGIAAAWPVSGQSARGKLCHPRAEAPLLGVGVDLLAISHTDDLLDFPPGALRRIFTEKEIRAVECRARPAAGRLLAGAFAIKEAAFKSLGTPLRHARQAHSGATCAVFPAELREVAVDDLCTEAPRAAFFGRTAETAERLGVRGLDVRVVYGVHMVAAMAFLLWGGADGNRQRKETEEAWWIRAR